MNRPIYTSNVIPEYTVQIEHSIHCNVCENGSQNRLTHRHRPFFLPKNSMDEASALHCFVTVHVGSSVVYNGGASRRACLLSCERRPLRERHVLLHANAALGSGTPAFLVALFSLAAAVRFFSNSPTATRHSLRHAGLLVASASQIFIFILQILRLCLRLSLYRRRGRPAWRPQSFS